MFVLASSTVSLSVAALVVVDASAIGTLIFSTLLRVKAEIRFHNQLANCNLPQQLVVLVLKRNSAHRYDQRSPDFHRKLFPIQCNVHRRRTRHFGNCWLLSIGKSYLSFIAQSWSSFKD